VVGNLVTPKDFDEDCHYEAGIVRGSFTSVKEQMPAAYAQKLADHGLVALAFDYAHYGESAGEPRQLESPDEKVSDLQAAVSYLVGLPFVQAVGMVGVCTPPAMQPFSPLATLAGRALVTVAAFLPSPELYRSLFGAEELAQRKERAAQA
jgi:fermentation-respiration switch protein FrsA (DUF1100 family)